MKNVIIIFFFLKWVAHAWFEDNSLSCFAGAVLSPLLVGVGDSVCFIPTYTVLVAMGWSVMGSARAEGFEEGAQ